MDDYAIEFVDKGDGVLLGIGGNGVYADEDVAGNDGVGGIVEGDDVGEIIVLEVLVVDSKDFWVGAENDGYLPYPLIMGLCDFLDPV